MVLVWIPIGPNICTATNRHRREISRGKRIFPDDLTLFKAVDQMLKDVVEATERGAPLSNIRWFLPKFLENTPIRQVFIDNVRLGDEILIEGLRGRLGQLGALEDEFARLVRNGTIFKFVPD